MLSNYDGTQCKKVTFPLVYGVKGHLCRWLEAQVFKEILLYMLQDFFTVSLFER